MTRSGGGAAAPGTRQGWRGAIVAALVVLVPAAAAARTAEVHVISGADIQRVHPGRPPDEPLEPAPAIGARVPEIVAAHPAFRGVTVRVVTGEVAPSPRTPADFLALVERGVDDVVVVHLDYHVRLDAFRASGTAVVQGVVAVHSVAGRRQVASRAFRVAAAYPGEIAREAVIEAELAARARGQAVPVEEIELGLLDAAVKQGLAPELAAALAVYNPASLPPVSREAVEEGMRRLARFLADSPDRRAEAVQVIEAYLRRFPAGPGRADLEATLRRLRQAPSRDASQDGQRARERAAQRVARTVTAGELVELFERLVGAVVEVRAFKLDWRDRLVVLSPVDRRQTVVLDDVPGRIRELDADPVPIWVLVVGRRADPRVPGVDVKVPVVRWVGCPATACP